MQETYRDSDEANAPGAAAEEMYKSQASITDLAANIETAESMQSENGEVVEMQDVKADLKAPDSMGPESG